MITSIHTTSQPQDTAAQPEHHRQPSPDTDQKLHIRAVSEGNIPATDQQANTTSSGDSFDDMMEKIYSAYWTL